MASFGKVLDLLNDRYLDLQDVFGNVEPLPTLVPYKEYTQNVLVYRMDTNHEIFMALIQDFTERRARETGKELWTWCVQWEVEARDSDQLTAAAHSPKKPRLAADTQLPQRKAAPIDIFERRIIDPELMQEEDMLRILIDIVQVESTIVPNFIEFLYRWIDFYEGDGKALKAALRWEIPSLWDFEYHPLVLPDDVKKKVDKARAEKPEADDPTKDGKDETGDKTPNKHEAEELAQGSPTKKMREKPDLAAMERQTEESERLQYREVKYGIQPPKLNEPLPPLINVPRDQRKRTKYYAACFKSRQRAYNLLLEAGITTQQISNYKKMQKEHPRDTPQDSKGDGLRYYQKDAQAAQTHFVEKEKQMLLREKQVEIAISNKLAAEAQLAARSDDHGGSSGVPLIPPTPSYARRPDMTADMLRRIKAIRGKGEERINVVPIPLVGRMKSKLFEDAKNKYAFNGLAWPGGVFPTRCNAPRANEEQEEGMEDNDDGDTDMDDDSQEGGSSAINRMAMNVTASRSGTSAAIPSHNLPRPSLPFPLPPPAPTTSLTRPPSSLIPGSSPAFSQHHTPGQVDTSGSAAAASSTPIPPNVAEYMRNLSPAQAQGLVSLMNPNARQTLASRILLQPPGAAGEGPAPMPRPVSNVERTATNTLSTSSLNSTAPYPQAPVSTATNPVIGASQASRPALPFLPPPPRPPTITVSPPQISNVQSQNQLSRGLEGQVSSIASQRPPGSLSLPSLPLPISGQGLQLRGMNQSGNLDSIAPYASGSRPPHSAAMQQGVARPQLPQLPQLPPFPNTPDVFAPPPPPSFAQRLLDIQRNQTASTPIQGSQHVELGTPRSPVQYGPQAPSQSLTISPPRPGIQRNAPSPLNLIPPPPSPLSSLAPSLLATSPFAASSHGLPIQIYLPKIVVPGNTLGPGGAKMGDGGIVETDAFLVGHAQPGSGKIVLGKAIFLPVGVWANTLRRVRRGAYTVLETYAPPPSHPKVSKGKGKAFFSTPSDDVKSPHQAVYAKLAQVYAFMSNSKNRERDLTKRWRASRGQMTLIDRGAVWEGWGVALDRGIEMDADERRGAVVSSGLIDEGVEMKVDEEEARRRKEMEELMAEDEDEDMEG